MSWISAEDGLNYGAPIQKDDASPPKISKDFVQVANLLETGYLSDIEVFVGPEAKKYNLHKAIISQNSGYFRAMFTNENFKETKENKVHLPERIPRFFEFTVYWLYHGTMKPPPVGRWLLESNIAMWRDAVYFDIPSLRQQSMTTALELLRDPSHYHIYSGTEAPVFERAVRVMIECYEIDRKDIEGLFLALHRGGFIKQILAADGMKDLLLRQPELMFKIIEIQSSSK